MEIKKTTVKVSKAKFVCDNKFQELEKEIQHIYPIIETRIDGLRLSLNESNHLIKQLRIQIMNLEKKIALSELYSPGLLQKIKSWFI